MLCYDVMLCWVKICCAMLCYVCVMLCYDVMLCYVVMFFVLFCAFFGSVQSGLRQNPTL